MHDTDITTPTISPPAGPKRRRVLKVILYTVGAFALLGVGSAIGSAGASPQAAHPAPAVTSTVIQHDAAAPAPTVTVTVTQPATAAAPAAAPAATTQAPAPPAITTSQQQALSAAQGYLDLGSGFSRAGLIAQLTSQYGSGFSQADAAWAADHSVADWNAQAVLAAKGYMNLGSGFSRAGLIDQLDSPYGGQFTLAQATYAAGQVGL